MKRTIGVLGLVIAGISSAAQGSTIYSNNFETPVTLSAGVTATLTGGSLTTAPNLVQHFLGELAAGSFAVLTLAGLSGFSSIDFQFDLYAVNSLDGNGDHCCGPDYFKVTTDTETLVEETFANNMAWTQSYGGTTPGGTGSDGALTGVLGYAYFGPDHTYHLNFSGIAANVNNLTISFFGNSDQGWNDEGFGIDNITVTGFPAATVPLPGGLSLLGLGLAGLAALRRRKSV